MADDAARSTPARSVLTEVLGTLTGDVRDTVRRAAAGWTADTPVSAAMQPEPNAREQISCPKNYAHPGLKISVDP